MIRPSPLVAMKLVQHKDHISGELNPAFILAAVAVLVAVMKDRNFQKWLDERSLDQQHWNAELLAALKRRFEASQQRLVVDGRGCQWPQRTIRVSESKEGI